MFTDDAGICCTHAIITRWIGSEESCNHAANLGRVVLDGCGSRLLPRLDSSQGPIRPHEGLLGGLVRLRCRGSQMQASTGQNLGGACRQQVRSLRRRPYASHLRAKSHMTLGHRLRESRVAIRCPREVDTLSSGACLRDRQHTSWSARPGAGAGVEGWVNVNRSKLSICVAERDAGNACRSAHGRSVHGPQIMGERTSASTPLHCIAGPVDKCRDKIVTRLSTHAPVMMSQTMWSCRLVDRGDQPCWRIACIHFAKPERYQYTQRGAPARLRGQQRRWLCVSLSPVRSGECTIIGVRSCFPEQHQEHIARAAAMSTMSRSPIAMSGTGLG